MSHIGFQARGLLILIGRGNDHKKVERGSVYSAWVGRRGRWHLSMCSYHVLLPLAENVRRCYALRKRDKTWHLSRL